MTAFEWINTIISLISVAIGAFVAVLAWKSYRRKNQFAAPSPIKHVPPHGGTDDYVRFVTTTVNDQDWRHKKSWILFVTVLLGTNLAAFFTVVFFYNLFFGIGPKTSFTEWAAIFFVPFLTIYTVAVFFYSKWEKRFATDLQVETARMFKDPRFDACSAARIVDALSQRRADYHKAVAISEFMFNELAKRENK
jgi:hypothetical protein